VYDLTGAEEFKRVTHIRVVYQAQEIVVSQASFLLCRKIFKQVGDRVAGGLNRCRAPGHT